ncbi:MAG: helix-turn-helix transcriptional regulator [Oscillospiraceae bacterium]|nr:helix-turn-helix transcriptional regulator [Oscillospiraceae bacterium]
MIHEKEVSYMFSENLKGVRKAKGLTQDELAIRLNVVRQTISKWEKGLSVPDAQMLIRIAEIFEVPVSELLGAKIENEADQNNIADQLSRINEQLAIKNRRGKLILKIILGIIIGVIILNILLIIVGMVSFNRFKVDKNVTVTTQSEIVMPTK